MAAGVAFYNPQVDDWSEQDAKCKAEGIAGGIAEVEAKAKDESQELLFVIDNKTRAIASILEATENITRGRNVTLVVNNIADGTVIGEQTITGAELKDLNRARAYLLDLARRNPTNAKVFDTIEDAVQHVITQLS
jgi:hypothetical protein